MHLQQNDVQGLEIAELLKAIRHRVRARYPGASATIEGGVPEPFAIPLADLLPLVHARDAAQAKVASIGSVNPRAGGFVNQAIQRVKRLVARSLGWFVRDQIVFNREILACVETSLEAMNDLNLAVGSLVAQFNTRAGRLHADAAALRNEADALGDMRSHWLEWRQRWERDIEIHRMQHLRAIADLQTGFNHRATLMEANFRDIARAQHADYLGALDRTNLDIQKRLWADLEKIRQEYERLIHSELRIIRQRLQPASPTPAAAAAPALDYEWFAERFRGPEQRVRSNQRVYVPYFQNIGRVLDLGCGRGEFLELMRENGIPARGVEASLESVAYCRSKGLDVEQGDLFAALTALPEQSEDAIFCSQVVEHLDPMRLPEMVRLCASRLRSGGILAIETPNPACLAIFATYFYLDPTHTRPVPSDLLAHYMRESGLAKTEVFMFSPARESFPELNSLPADFVDRFFGGLDYGILGWRV
jgi:O-antigen chain-terminating methyltransferase